MATKEPAQKKELMPSWGQLAWFLGMIIMALSNYYSNRASDNKELIDLKTEIVELKTKVNIVYAWYERKVN